MLLVTLSDVFKHIYPETANEIVRGDDGVIQEKIDIAIAEAKGFMSRYDLPKLFGTPSVNPTIVDANLRAKLIDLVRWHLLGLSAPNIEYEDARNRYEYAINDYFKPIAAGKLMPADWPYRDATADTAPEGNDVSYSSNQRRSNHF